MPEFQKEIGTWLVCVCAKQLTFKVHFENENTIVVFMQTKGDNGTYKYYCG